MDTSQDFRIRLAEKAIAELEKLMQNVRIQRRKELFKELKTMQSWVQVVKYSYVPIEDLVKLEEFSNLVTKARGIRTAIKNAEKDFNYVQANYWLEYIESLPQLMERGEISRAYEVIRYFSGEITNRVKIGGLWLCSFDCTFRLDVVTNSEMFKPGRYAVVAYLPPRRFGDVVSEGMFVDAELNKKGELGIEEIRKLDTGEVEGIILNLLS